MEEYFILDNRDCPFRVTIDDNKNVKVFNYENNAEILSFKNVHEYFLGKSEFGDKRFYVDAEYEGNTIIIRPTEELLYISVSRCIQLFMLKSPIVDYYSDIGNNLVPYPYAVLNDDKILLMLYFVEISNISEDILEEIKNGHESAYEYYYGHSSCKFNEDIVKNKVYNDKIYTRIGGPHHPMF